MLVRVKNFLQQILDAIAAHEAKEDPHPDYLLVEEGEALVNAAFAVRETPTVQSVNGSVVTPGNSKHFQYTLTANITLNPPSPLSPGVYSFTLIQDATGNKTVTFSTAYKWPGGIIPTLSTAANSVDIVNCVSNGTILRCVIQKDFK